MWNSNNADLEAKYGRRPSGSVVVPSDSEYGEYIVKELLSLGYVVKHMRASSSASVFAFGMSLFGKMPLVVFCIPSRVSIDVTGMRKILAYRSVFKATYYAVITNSGLTKDASDIAARNDIFITTDFHVGDNIFSFLSCVGLVPQPTVNYFMKLKYDCEIYEEQSAKEREALAAEAEAARREAAMRAPHEMTALEKYDAGMYGDDVSTAVAMCGISDVVSAGGLARRMRIDVDTAKRLLNILEEMGVVGPSERSKPRDVLMTPGMIEKRFRVRIPF